MSGRVSLGRVVAVTGALMGIGAVCGGVIGALLMLMAAVRDYARNDVGSLTGGTIFGASIGAAIGAVLTPILAWIFLRRVALGRALIETAVGTLAGGAIALVVAPVWFFAAAIAGFVAAGISLYIRTRRTPPAADPRLRDG